MQSAVNRCFLFVQHSESNRVWGLSMRSVVTVLTKSVKKQMKKCLKEKTSAVLRM